MAYNPNNIQEWKLNDYEIAKTCETVKSESGKFKLFIPKLMPLINYGKPTKTKQYISSSIFANADECKPSISTTVTTQNFRTLCMLDNDEFSKTLIPSDTEIQIEIKNGNPDSMYITSKIDNSAGENVTKTFDSELCNGSGSMTIHGIPTENGNVSATVEISNLSLNGTNIERAK